MHVSFFENVCHQTFRFSRGPPDRRAVHGTFVFTHTHKYRTMDTKEKDQNSSISRQTGMAEEHYEKSSAFLLPG